MTERLKETILYSDELTKLILSGTVIGVYLGGSRLYNLNSLDADYDVIVLTKDDSLIHYNKRKLKSITDYNVHIHINPLSAIVKLLQNPVSIPNFNHATFMLDAFFIKENFIIYNTTAFSNLLSLFKTNEQSLATLVLEKLLNTLTNKVVRPICKYNKLYYRILFVYYLLQNYIEHNSLMLTSSQEEILFNTKHYKRLPVYVHEALSNLKPHNFYSNRFSYENLYKEMKMYEQ